MEMGLLTCCAQSLAELHANAEAQTQADASEPSHADTSVHMHADKSVCPPWNCMLARLARLSAGRGRVHGGGEMFSMAWR